MNKSLNPSDHLWVSNSSVYEWREYLKKALLEQRHWKSDLSGKSLINGCHMHEGIVTRATVPKTIWWHYKIFHPFNSFLLLPGEHMPQPPTRAWCIQRAYELYGRDNVRDWFYSLNWKDKPPFQLL